MKQTYVVFISLIIDLLAFTLILPLLPKIFDFYESNKDVSFICLFCNFNLKLNRVIYFIKN
jgi:hypothetical protein